MSVEAATRECQHRERETLRRCVLHADHAGPHRFDVQSVQWDHMLDRANLVTRLQEAESSLDALLGAIDAHRGEAMLFKFVADRKLYTLVDQIRNERKGRADGG